MTYEHDYTNPYLQYLPEQLESFIAEITCEEQDCVFKGLLDRIETVREHRAMATDALLKMAGVWA